jgi:MYXO-CTERM domain-containing protein
VNNNVLDFTLWASAFTLPNRMTELRVLTAAVPAPGAIALLGLAGLVGVRRRG